MAKNEKKAAGKPAAAEPSGGEHAAKSGQDLALSLGAVRRRPRRRDRLLARQRRGGRPAGEKDPDLAELMAPGPLEDISLGKADAPNTIVEYASMTCPHCADVPHNGAARS